VKPVHREVVGDRACPAMRMRVNLTPWPMKSGNRVPHFFARHLSAINLPNWASVGDCEAGTSQSSPWGANRRFHDWVRLGKWVAEKSRAEKWDSPTLARLRLPSLSMNRPSSSYSSWSSNSGSWIAMRVQKQMGTFLTGVTDESREGPGKDTTSRWRRLPEVWPRGAHQVRLNRVFRLRLTGHARIGADWWRG
jgi:hypothetical protein